jgi:hypothetical protein
MEFENINRYNLKEIMKTAAAYRITFSTPPWSEVSRGPKCDNFYGPGNPPGTICPCGCGKLEEAYPIIKTTGYIRNEISKQNSITLTATKNDKLIAFGWGYVETGEEFANQKYKTKEGRKIVAETVGREKTFFYLSEFGVIPEERSKGIGTEITKKVMERAFKLNLPFLMRTNKSSFMYKIARNLGMIPIMGSENTPPDPENSERILFTRQLRKRIRIPTISEYLNSFSRPNYLDDPRTPEPIRQEMIRKREKEIEDEYYKKYGQETIESLEFGKEEK